MHPLPPSVSIPLYYSAPAYLPPSLVTYLPIHRSLPVELGMQMGMKTTGRFVVISNLGEALEPLCVGYAIKAFGGYPTLALWTLICVGLMITCFVSVLVLHNRGLKVSEGRAAEVVVVNGEDSKQS